MNNKIFIFPKHESTYQGLETKKSYDNWTTSNIHYVFVHGFTGNAISRTRIDVKTSYLALYSSRVISKL